MAASAADHHRAGRRALRGEHRRGEDIEPRRSVLAPLAQRAVHRPGKFRRAGEARRRARRGEDRPRPPTRSMRQAPVRSAMPCRSRPACARHGRRAPAAPAPDGRPGARQARRSLRAALAAGRRRAPDRPCRARRAGPAQRDSRPRPPPRPEAQRQQRPAPASRRRFAMRLMARVLREGAAKASAAGAPARPTSMESANRAGNGQPRPVGVTWRRRRACKPVPRVSRHAASQPTDPGFVQDPYPFYERARAAGPLFFWDDYGLVCATRRRRRRGAAERPPLRPRPRPQALRRRARRIPRLLRVEDHSMLELEPPRHTRLRARVTRAFTSPANRAAEDGLRALCAEGSTALSGPFDLIDCLARPLPVIAICRLLGVPEAMAGPASRLVERHGRHVSGPPQRALEHAADAAAAVRRLPARLHRPPAPAPGRRPDLRLLAPEAATKLSEDEAGGHLHPAAQRRPRGDGAHARQWRAGADPDMAPGPAALHRRRHRRHGRRGAALRPAAASVHPLGL